MPRRNYAEIRRFDAHEPRFGRRDFRRVILFLFSSVSTFAQSDTEKGIELYRNGNFSQAIVILDNAVNADKKDLKAWTYLGASHFKSGN